MNKSQTEIRNDQANQARSKAINRLILTQEARLRLTEGTAILLAALALGEALALFLTR